MKNFMVLIIICLVNISCTKRTNEFNLPNMSDDLVINPTIVDGTLSFKSVEELNKTWEYLSKLSLDEKIKWEETHGFYSIERRTEEGFRAIHKANIKESEEMLNKALIDFADVIELRGDSYTPIYDNGLYDFVCNLKGMFIISQYVQIVKSKQIDVYNLDDFDDLNQNIVKTPVYSYQFASKLYTKSAPTDLEAEYYYNLTGCKNDRRVYVTAHSSVLFEPMTITNPNYPEGFVIMVGLSGVLAEVYGTERNWLCNWSRYETILSYRNASFTGYGYQNDEAIPWFPFSDIGYPHATSSTITPFTVTTSAAGAPSSYTTPDERQSLYFMSYFGYRMLNEGLLYDEMVNNYQGFISAHFEGSSRGVNGNWAVIDYNGK